MGVLANAFNHTLARPPELEAPALEALLDRLVARGRAAWPSVDVEPAGFARFLAARVEPEAPVVDALAALHADDLYLAYGCALGDAAALSLFDAQFLSQVRVFLGRMKPSAQLVDEVRQTLRVKLLVEGAPGAPRIAEYSGRGALLSWLRVSAIRAAVDALRAAEPGAVDEGEDIPDLAPALDAELAYVQSRYRGELNDAFKAALTALSPQQRNVLRLHLVKGLTIDQIGAVLRVHRSTAARWLSDVRTAIFDGARRRVNERLRLAPGEFDSLVRMLHSQLDVSVARLLLRR